MYLDVLFSLPVHSSFTYELPPEMTCAIGYRVTAPFGGRSLTGYVIATHERKPEGFTVKPIKRVIDKEAVFGEDQIALASWMAALYFCSQGEALALMIPGGRKEIDLPALGLEEIPEAKDLELSVPQKEALRSICEDDHSLYYLFGVTGSGKTEVFLQAAQKVIAGGGV